MNRYYNPRPVGWRYENESRFLTALLRAAFYQRLGGVDLYCVVSHQTFFAHLHGPDVPYAEESYFDEKHGEYFLWLEDNDWMSFTTNRLYCLSDKALDFLRANPWDQLPTRLIQQMVAEDDAFRATLRPRAA